MPTVYPTAAGNWSTRTWNNDATGAAYGTTPQPGDIVLANGVTVTIDQNITVAELRTSAGTTAVAGGLFSVSGTRTINANVAAGTSSCVSVPNSAVATINGTITGGSSTNAAGVALAGTASGSLTANGAVTGGSGTNANGISITGAGGSAVIVGAMQGATGRALEMTTGFARVTGNVTGSSTGPGITQLGGRLVVVGDVTGGSGGFGISHAVGALAVFGNVTAGSGNGRGISSASGGLYIRGNVSANDAVNGINFTAVTTVSDFCVVYGTVTGGSSTGIGIANAGAGRVDIFGSTVDSGGAATSNTGSGSINVTAVSGGGGGGSVAFNPVVRLP